MDLPRVIRNTTCILLICASFGRLDGAEPTAEEHKIKAAFLYNFIKFAEWPEKAFPMPNSPIVLGVLGKTPVLPWLEEVARGQTIHGRSIEVRSFASLDGIENSHMLFVVASEKRRWRETLDHLKNAPVLTVGEERFAEQGGMIGFVKAENRIRFEINVDAARRAEIKIQPGLLNLAKIVRASDY